MVVKNSHLAAYRSGYAGLRLTADEYFALPDDGNRYELIDGVVSMSPSPLNSHQLILAEVVFQLESYVRPAKLGRVYIEADVRLATRPDGRDLVYRPELHFVRADRLHLVGERTTIVPDIVLEVLSDDSRGRDLITKLGDYREARVGEIWMIDPRNEVFAFYRLRGDAYEELRPVSGKYASAVVPGFELNLDPIRALFRAIGGG
ncbi:MAG: Uma2 family endonuclease [Phycisphaerae bacterium]